MEEKQIMGLTAAEVDARIAAGKMNYIDKNENNKSTKQIILANSLTFFNILNLIFFVLIISVGSFKNGLFFLIVLINTGIGIFQEIRTKKTLDSLSMLSAAKIPVVREGKVQEILTDEIVLDDIILLKSGDQIPADAEVIDGEIEVNESMLTGESDNIPKHLGDSIYSGAFITSGKAVCHVIHVGPDNYIESLSKEAKRFKKVNSELRNHVNRILKVVSYFIIPLSVGLGLRLFLTNPLHAAETELFRVTIEQVVSSGIGMIPEGLYLLTTLSLTLGMLKLAKKRTIVQELYCIETLARVDVLCLDKTGTLTEGKIQVENVVPLVEDINMESIFQNLCVADEAKNATSEGLFNYFGAPKNIWNVKRMIPFSSERKYSGAVFEGKGSYYIGAVQFLFPEEAELIEKVQSYANDGLRVLVLGHSSMETENNELPEGLKPLGYVVMSDVIRNDCKNTMEFFKNEGVQLRVISGDDPLTVSRIAEKCGVENASAYVDASTLTEEMMDAAVEKYTVFGRVKPEQKKMLVAALKRAGHTVAMTGDGVNDVLALKEADCSIAMASGSDAAKQTSDIVLLDSDFASMPDVVRQGRRVINNICSAASMYLIKTTFSVLLALGTVIFGTPYPFQAIQLSVISACAVGIPTFLLQLEANYEQVKDNFMQRVFKNSVPSGIVIGLLCLLITLLGEVVSGVGIGTLSTVCVFSIGFIYFYTLKRTYAPMSLYRKAVIYIMEIVYLAVMVFGSKIIINEVSLLELTSISPVGIVVLVASITVSPMLIDLFQGLYERYMEYRTKKKAERLQKTETKRIANERKKLKKK